MTSGYPEHSVKAKAALEKAAVRQTAHPAGDLFPM